MTYAQRLAEAIVKEKAEGRFAFVSNPIDVQRFAIQWLLDRLDELELRVSRTEGRVAALQGDGK